MTSRSTTLAVLGLLAGFVNVDAFHLIPAAAPGGAASSSLARAQQQQSPIASREASTRRRGWQSRGGGLAMSTPAVGDIAAPEEVEEKPSRASVMDELDAILGDAKMVSGGWVPLGGLSGRAGSVGNRAWGRNACCMCRDGEVDVGPCHAPRPPTTPEPQKLRGGLRLRLIACCCSVPAR